MKEDTRREIRKWMAYLLCAALCIASITYGYAEDTQHSRQEGSDIKEGEENAEEKAAQTETEAADAVKEKVQKGMEDLQNTVSAAKEKVQQAASAVKEEIQQAASSVKEEVWEAALAGKEENGQSVPGGKENEQSAAAGKEDGQGAVDGKASGQSASGGKENGQTAAAGKEDGQSAAAGKKKGQSAADGKASGQSAPGGKEDGQSAAAGKASGQSASGGKENGQDAVDGKASGQSAAGEESGQSAIGGKASGQSALQKADEARNYGSPKVDANPQQSSLSGEDEASKNAQAQTGVKNELQKAAKDDTNIVEVSDLNSLRKAVADAEADLEISSKSGGMWNSRRLLVQSDAEFDTMGAENVICGYGNVSILDYATEKAAKAAYEKLKQIPGLSVEADSAYCGLAADLKHAIVPAEASDGAKRTETGKSVCAAVLDTGYDVNYYGRKRITGGADLSSEGFIQDKNGHGTAMANLILDQAPDCVSVMPVKVADENGRTSSLKLYMGIRYALENGADLINISMGAPQAANSQIVAEAIRQARQAGIATVVSAGNAGQDVSAFSPADAPDAIVVAAVNGDKSRMEYSNFGAGVDYCSYGKVSVSGLDGSAAECSGTSVAAAIVSGLIAGEKAQRAASYDALLVWLDQKAEDLGEAGRDIYFGKGLLSPENLKVLEETEEPCVLPELLAVDWEQIPDTKLNELIGESDELIVRRFLDLKTKEERKEIVKRASILKNDHVELVYDADKNEQSRNVASLYDYLYSDRFEAYYIQKKISGTYYMYIQNATRKVYLTTNQNGAKCALNVKFSGTKTNPADDPTITVSGTSAGAIDLSNAKIDGVKTFTDDNGNQNTIGQVGVSGIAIKKRAHSQITGQSKSVSLKNHLWSGGFTAFGSNRCEDATSSGCKLMVGVGDLQLNKNQVVQTYQINITEYHPSDFGAWSGWAVTANASCCQPGVKQHSRSKACSNCGKTVQTETKTASIPQLVHNFSNAPWSYAINNGILNGERWLQCNYACGAAPNSSGYDAGMNFWRQNYQYLQQIFYRYMDVNGNYPAYTAFVNDYYPSGSRILSCSYVETAVSEYKNTPGTPEYIVAGQANLAYIDIPRKKYRVVYDGNGADSGSVSPQEVYCGQSFDLRPNGFSRRDYEFLGWSQGPGKTALNGKGCINLSYTDGDTVTLYAIWKPVGICISLDNRGANLDAGTAAVYEKYSAGYYQNQELTDRFIDGRIRIPKKQRPDPQFPDGMRRQQFMGYYTKPEGRGDSFILKNGNLRASVGGKAPYTYFRKDSVVYAHWQDMYAVRFDPNLSEKDLALLNKGENGEPLDKPVVCPEIRWVGQNETVTVSNGDAIIQNRRYCDFYRFLGWSLTPEINSPDEIVLNGEIPAYTYRAAGDLTLYAQWDTSFAVAYVGNGQTSGVDFLKREAHITDIHTFAANQEEKPKHYFTKTEKKPTMDVATGQMKSETGEPFTERVKYRLMGWGMEPERIGEQEIYTDKNPGMTGAEMACRAKSSILFGRLPESYGLCHVPHAPEEEKLGEKLPVITLYAVWDSYPQIFASDMYVPLSDAQNGVLTKDYLLSQAKAFDEELKCRSNAKGLLEPGTDPQNNTSFTIQDYQAEEFLLATQEMSVTLTYCATDAAGNTATKMVRVYLVDTAGRECNTGKVRFISEKYINTLPEDSVWRTGDYADTLSHALGNKKTKEEYTNVTPAQKAFGMKPVKKPGSGAWDHVQEIWKFTHEQALQIQQYIQTAGAGGDPSVFLAKFGHCRIK